jgi:hypothetical protein
MNLKIHRKLTLAVIAAGAITLPTSSWPQASVATEDAPETDSEQAQERRFATRHGTYHSLQRKTAPPLPFCPFPDLPVYEVSPGRFVYDDLKVDYRALQESARLRSVERATTLSKSSAQTAKVKARSVILSATNAQSGGQSQAMSAGSPLEHLDLVPGEGGTNVLYMSELHVGSNYYVMAKQDITPSLENPWYFIGGFTATDPNMAVTLFTSPEIGMEFYTLWRGEYFGPSLAISSPANGEVVTGDVVIKLSLAHISPVSLYAYVNGQPLWPVGELLTVDTRSQIGVKHAGSAEMVVPAGALRNGENYISIVAMNHGVEVIPDTNTLYLGNIANFSTTRDVLIVSSNVFAIVANPDMVSLDAGTAIHRLETTQPGTVSMDILGLDGSLCCSMVATVTHPSGEIVTFDWDFTHADSTPYTNSAYVARCTFVPTGAGLAGSGAASRTLWFTNSIDRNPLISGSPLLTWMELNATPIEQALDALCDDVFQGLYDFFSWAIPQLFYTPAEIGVNRTFPVKWKFNEITMTNDVVFFHRFMTNRNFDSWVYHGHCNQEAIGFSTAGGAPGAPGTTVTANSVANDLGNLYGTGSYMGTVEYKRRLRTVVMHGCWTANINGRTNGGSPPVITE